MIRYHAWWPSAGDPYYQYNISENQARIYYYGVQNIGVPYLKVDGTLTPDPWTASEQQNAINSRLLVPSPCTIEVTTENVTSTTVDVTVRLTAEEDMLSSSNRLFVALKHNCHLWGSVHWHPFRDIQPSTSGLSFQIAADSTLEYSTTFTFSSGFETDDMRIVAFAQNYSSKEVYQSAMATLNEPPSNLVVNEIMSENLRFNYLDPQGEHEDWVELFNPGPDDVNLLGFYLTNDFSDLELWAFPDTLLLAYDHIVIWCDNDVADPGLHASFSLNNNGDAVGLFAEGTTCSQLIDVISFGDIGADKSYGRSCDGAAVWQEFFDVTPDATNAGCEDNVQNLVSLVSGSDLQLFWEPVAWAASYT
ncbi:lamin tail domain-containing protein, partial [bacterium]|nr:lamin tail domain-containing protein [bacterium]